MEKIKKTKVSLIERTFHDIIEIELPNGGIVRFRTSNHRNEIEVTYIQLDDEQMFIKPLRGNQFEIISANI